MTVARKRPTGLAELGIPLDLAPMEAKLVTELPKEAGWQFEPKWDGFDAWFSSCRRRRRIKAKSGKSLSRFFPEVLENLRAVGQDICASTGNWSFRLMALSSRCAAKCAYILLKAASFACPMKHRLFHRVRLPPAKGAPVSLARVV
jgi:hypothetical protein